MSETWVVCLRNEGYAASLERRKVYRLIQDENASGHGLLRVVDESGEDFLYPQDFFARVELSDRVRQALDLAA